MDVIKENINIILNLKTRKQQNLTRDVFEMIELIVETSEFQVTKLHEEYIRNLQYIYPLIEKNFSITEEMEWPYHAKSIYDGKYPLEKLPSHLRSLARNLYYQRSMQ